MIPAILFEPDGYLLTGPKLMGRQSAGHGFLRAAIAARGGKPLTAYTPFEPSIAAFRRLVAEIDPTCEIRWAPSRQLELLAEIGGLYRPDPGIANNAWHRLKAGSAAYSLCGVTHGLAGEGTLGAIAAVLTAPVMAWDALVCTSTAALEVVSATLERQADYLRWRSGQAEIVPPLLSLIPLGVHCADFVFSDGDRETARRALRLEAQETVVLSAGRISANTKAHPYATLRALQLAARETGRPMTLLAAGQPASEAVGAEFQAAVAAHAPDVRLVTVDGKDPAGYRRSWAAADIFISLADSIQETFGLTPVEAMAAGLPVLVSDWNGYKDTVRDGVDGFRIPPWAPVGGGEDIAQAYEMNIDSLSLYMTRTMSAVAADVDVAAARLGQLVLDAPMRREMGVSGRARARALFDWATVFESYQALWAEQEAIRRRAAADPQTEAWLSQAPTGRPDQLSPFHMFAGYPSRLIADDDLVSTAPEMTMEHYRWLIEGPMPTVAIAPIIVERMLAALSAGPMTVKDLAVAVDLPPDRAGEVAVRLSKIDVVKLAANGA
jgi:starch synthase